MADERTHEQRNRDHLLQFLKQGWGLDADEAPEEAHADAPELAHADPWVLVQTNGGRGDTWFSIHENLEAACHYAGADEEWGSQTFFQVAHGLAYHASTQVRPELIDADLSVERDIRACEA